MFKKKFEAYIKIGNVKIPIIEIPREFGDIDVRDNIANRKIQISISEDDYRKLEGEILNIGGKKMKFKVGDKVKVRADLKVDEKYEGIYFVEDMEEFKGKIVTIRSANSEDEKTIYKIEEDIGYEWVESMFELIKFTKKELLEMPIGTKVITDREEYNIFVKIADVNFVNDDCYHMYDTDITEDLEITDSCCGTKILRVEKVSLYEVVYEYHPEEAKEMTVAEIEKILGHKVKIVKEEK